MINNNNEEKRKHRHENDTENVRNENTSGRENAQEREESNEPLDLDHDGMIGNTGGFYGGTSYLGSNYEMGMNSSQTGRTENERMGQNASNSFEEGEQDETGELTEEDNII